MRRSAVNKAEIILILLQLGHDQPHDIVFTCMQETGSTFDHFINLTQGRGEGHVEDRAACTCIEQGPTQVKAARVEG